VSAELIKYIIESEGQLDSLHSYQTQVSQTPSWVPQIPGPVPQERSFNPITDEVYCASADLRPCVQFSADLKRITIRGLTVDTVAAVQGPFDSKTDVGVKLLCTREFQDATRAAVMPHLHGCDPDTLEWTVEERLSKTLILGKTLDFGEGPPASYRDMYQLINSRSRQLAEMDKGGADMAELMRYLAQDVMPYALLCMDILSDRCFVTTQNGHIGVAPCNVQVGDQLCVFFGGSAFQVLRKEADHYLLIGDAYVDGLMNGEVIQLYQKSGSGLQEQDFVIW
jgi:hypothetical protein